MKRSDFSIALLQNAFAVPSGGDSPDSGGAEARRGGKVSLQLPASFSATSLRLANHTGLACFPSQTVAWKISFSFLLSFV